MMENQTKSDDKNIDEERVISNSKQYGHKRTSPQTSPEKITKQVSLLICDQCGYELESQGLLDSHMKEHASRVCYTCEDCNHEFILRADYVNHIKNVHARKSFACDNYYSEIFVLFNIFK